MASKSKLSRVFRAGSEPSCRHAFETDGERRLDPPVDHACLAIEEFELDQPGVIQPLGRALPGNLLVLAQDGGQLQLLEVMAEQDL